MAEEARDDEREALGWAEAEAYADDSDPSKRMETMDDFMTGWRTADRTRKHPEPEITDEMVERGALVLHGAFCLTRVYEGQGGEERIVGITPFDWLSEESRAHYRTTARAVLEAALRVPVGEGENRG